MEKKLTSLKTEVVDDTGESFVVEYDILPTEDISVLNPLRSELNAEIANVDNQLDALRVRLDSLNSEIDRLTNHADGIDYAVAVASGVLTGIIDILFVGEFNPDINKVVEEFAKRKGCPAGKDPQTFLQEKYHSKNDGAYMNKRDIFGNKLEIGGPTHRLDDFAHHPTILGLVCSIAVQFINVGLYVNRNGKWHLVVLDEQPSEMAKKWIPIIISGILLWLSNVAEKYVEDQIDAEIPKPLKTIIKMLASTPAIIQIMKCADNWKGHIMSDINTPAGIPGIFLSLLKEISSLPLLKDTDLPEKIMKLYTSHKFDFGSEVAVFSELKKQAIPVLINELFVRTFYFVRYLIKEYKDKNGFQNINWQNVIPFNNRTIARMMTIASGTFTAIDMADAAIHGAAESGGTLVGFAKGFILRVNFVGIGRFAVAVGTDVGMGIKREKLRNERMKLIAEVLNQYNVKLYYKNTILFIEDTELFDSQKQMWIAAKDTEETLTMACKAADDSMLLIVGCLNDIADDMEKISSYRDAIEQHNPGLTKEIASILKWGYNNE